MLLRYKIPSRPSAKLMVLSLLLISASLLSGCVYLRLLKFKSQLKHFDQNVVVMQEDGLTLAFRTPLVRDSDFLFLTESLPNSIDKLSESPLHEVWTWNFYKYAPSPEHDSYEVCFKTHFEEGLLTQIEFDPALLEALPAEAIVAVFKRLGSAKINKLRRSATATVEANAYPQLVLPSLTKVQSVLGEPSKRLNANSKPVWKYIFNFYNPEDKSLSGQFQLDIKGNRAADKISSIALTGKGQ